MSINKFYFRVADFRRSVLGNFYWIESISNHIYYHRFYHLDSSSYHVKHTQQHKRTQHTHTHLDTHSSTQIHTHKQKQAHIHTHTHEQQTHTHTHTHLIVTSFHCISSHLIHPPPNPPHHCYLITYHFFSSQFISSQLIRIHLITLHPSLSTTSPHQHKNLCY